MLFCLFFLQSPPAYTRTTPKKKKKKKETKHTVNKVQDKVKGCIWLLAVFKIFDSFDTKVEKC